MESEGEGWKIEARVWVRDTTAWEGRDKRLGIGRAWLTSWQIDCVTKICK